MEFVVVTGMSGAGKSKVIDALEDIGFFCVDNVPPFMLSKFSDMQKKSGGTIERIAVVVDARGRQLFCDFLAGLDELHQRGDRFRLLFLDAEDGVLLKRFKEGRRKHPLLDGEKNETIGAAIVAERAMLRGAKARADYVIDTSLTTSGQLKERVVKIFIENSAETMPVHCLSFGFKNGLPGDADLVFDVRCLPNPFYQPDLREKTGLEAPVCDYVMRVPQSGELLQRLIGLIDFLLPLYLAEGKSQLVIAIGCTGGKHRSVVFAQKIGEHLANLGVHAIISHRDKDKRNHGQQ